MKKLLILVFITLFTFSFILTGCNNGEGTGTNAGNNGGVAQDLAVQIGPDPETIDPALNSAVDGGNMLLHSFECLLTVDQNGQLQPGQAEKWEASADGFTWTFTLRDGLKWSDGTPLTAEDFVYSWKRVVDPNTAAPYAETVLGMVKGYKEASEGNVDALAVSAPDEKTLVVELTSPCTYFGSLAAFATLNPVQKATIEANGDAWATKAETYICNGAFYIKEWIPGQHILMAKNENYWNKDAIKLNTLKFVLMEDSNASLSAYRSGDILLTKDVPTEEIPSLKDGGEFFVEPIIGTYYLSLNTSKAPYDDPKVRKALSLAIDRAYVAGTLMQGTYSPAYNFIGPGWMDTDGKEFIKNSNGGKTYISEDYEANLEEAKKLLAEAGYPNGEGFGTIKYMTNDSGYHKTVAEYLQEAWKQLGITTTVDIVEWSSFTSTRRDGNYDVARNGWVGDYDDPSNMLDLLFSSNGNNDGKYNNADYDAAMTDSRTITDPAKRSAALHKAEDILMEEAACIPLAYYNDFWLQSPKLKGAWHSATGYWYFHTAEVTE